MKTAVVTELEAHGRKVRIGFDDPEDLIASRVLRSRDFYERDLLEDARKRVKNRAVIDVGAHVGNHTLWFAGICCLPVIAMEPNPDSFAQLAGNIELNGLRGMVIARPMAAGASPGRCSVIPPAAGNSGTSQITKDEDGSVKVVRIDDFANDSVGLLKIDVEGYQMPVLEGAVKTLSEAKPVVYIEAATEDEQSRVKAFLSEFKYEQFGVFCKTPTLGLQCL